MYINIGSFPYLPTKVAPSVQNGLLELGLGMRLGSIKVGGGGGEGG